MEEPDKWYIKVTPENKKAIEKWRTANALLSDKGYCVNKTSFDDPSIGYWHPDKPEGYTEISFEEFKVYTSKPLKQAVHCTTQEEWDFVNLKMKFTAKFGISSCVRYLDDGCISSIEYFKEKHLDNYQLLSFQEWCDLNGYKMEKSKQEILKEFAEKYPPGTKVKSPDGVEFIISTTHKHKGKNNDFLQGSPHYIGLCGEVLAVKENSCTGEYLYKDGKYAEIIKDTPIFEVGKWYKNLNKNSPENTFGKFLNLRNNDKEFWMSEYIYNGKFHSIPGWLNYSSETVEIDIEEIQQYLPDGHPDKIKSNQEFKVGERCIWKAGDKVDVFKIYNIHNSGNRIHGNNGNHYDTDKVRHATTEEINQHLISIGHELKSKPDNIGGMCIGRYMMNANHLGVMYQGDIMGKPVKPKMTLSIDDEELPLVNIIKTNTVKQLLNSE